MFSRALPPAVCLPRSYTKPRGQIPDYNAPVVLHATNPSIADFCDRIHKGLLRNLK
jgi:ribosome-interacting GTPase 1